MGDPQPRAQYLAPSKGQGPAVSSVAGTSPCDFSPTQGRRLTLSTQDNEGGGAHLSPPPSPSKSLLSAHT